MAKLRTGFMVGGLSGSTGGAVLVQRRDGSVILRERVTPRDPETPLQLANRARLQRAAAVYRALTPEEHAAWRDYAARLRAPSCGQAPGPAPSAQNLFTGLAVRYLHLHGGEEAPRLPPARAFLGDGVALAAEGGPGRVVFTAGGPNSDGVVTELLVQRMRTAASGRYPRAYRHGAYVAFAPGSLSAEVAAARGWVAPAVRFVATATGQASGLVELTPVLVV
jgi:hypothetical protein